MLEEFLPWKLQMEGCTLGQWITQSRYYFVSYVQMCINSCFRVFFVLLHIVKTVCHVGKDVILYVYEGSGM